MIRYLEFEKKIVAYHVIALSLQKGLMKAIDCKF